MPADQHPPSRSDRRGHVALVTGAASGIGAATALVFARQGMHVVVLDIDEDRIHDTVAQIEGLGAHGDGRGRRRRRSDGDRRGDRFGRRRRSGVSTPSSTARCRSSPAAST